MIGFLLRSSRWLFVLSVAAGLVGGLGGVGLIAAINLALERGPDMELAWLFAGLCVLLLLARSLSAFMLLRIGQDAILGLRLQVCRRVLAAPYPRLQALGPAQILACLTQDVGSLAEAFRQLPMVCVNLAMIAGSLAYLGWLSGPPLLLVGGTLLLGIASFLAVAGRAVRGLGKAREYDDALHGHFRSLTDGIKELKLHRPRRDAFLAECLEADSARYRRHYLSGMGASILATHWGNALFYAVIGAVLFALPLCQETGAEVLRGYCLTILYLMSPVGALVDSLPVFGRAGIALRKINALGLGPQEAEPPAPVGPRFSARPARLDLVGVTHRYRGEGDDTSFTLGPLDLSLRPGELVFLVGGNGSGKTTLSLLLVGLYAPEQGELRLGGRRVGAAERGAYRQQFSAVFADFHLFDRLLGFDFADLDEQARAYLAQLRLAHKVRVENGSFSTLELSQGQRKRLALLVAYLEDRPFYLFDEWAADQDPAFKKIFYTEILPALKAKGKTVVVITHDDQYFGMADRCLRLDEGRLGEMPGRQGKPGLREPANPTGLEWGTTSDEGVWL